MTAALNLQDQFVLCAGAGYDRDLKLHESQVQAITARLRGIAAITAVLTVASDAQLLTLGDRINTGLIEAITALADDACDVLDRADEHASAQRGTA